MTNTLKHIDRRTFLGLISASGVAMLASGCSVLGLGPKPPAAPAAAPAAPVAPQAAPTPDRALAIAQQQAADAKTAAEAAQKERDVANAKAADFQKQLEEAKKTPTPAPTTEASKTTNVLEKLTDYDREILAKIGGLHEQEFWQNKLTGEYKDWTGIALPVFDPTQGKMIFYGLYDNGQVKEMPSKYTPEKNPVTATAWTDKDGKPIEFPDGYFGGVQPLNAPDNLPSPDGRQTVAYRAYWANTQEHRAPYDFESWASEPEGVTFGFAQGTNLRIGDFNSKGAAFALAVPRTNLHLWITEGEVDGIRTPRGMSPEAAYTIARIWFAGYIASTGANQLKQHRGYLKAQQIIVQNGADIQKADVTTIWPNITKR